MQAEFRSGQVRDRQIVLNFGAMRRPPGQMQVESQPHNRREHFRINYCVVMAEWTTTFVALGLLSFYVYAILTAEEGEQQENIFYKLLVAYVILSAYIRLCYVLTTVSKTYLLVTQGPCEATALPGRTHINAVSSLMFMVEPAHFICLCWITHIAFPLTPCMKGVTRYTCISLNIAATIFVSMWILTGLAVLLLVISVSFFDNRQRGRSTWLEQTLGTEAVQSSLRMTALPDALRDQIVGNLPTTTVPPDDGDPCAICFEIQPGDEWRVLPCGHRFHPGCVDDWLKKQRGTCPTCRHDPTLPPQTSQVTGECAPASDAAASDAAAAAGASGGGAGAGAGGGVGGGAGMLTGMPVALPESSVYGGIDSQVHDFSWMSRLPQGRGASASGVAESGPAVRHLQAVSRSSSSGSGSTSSPPPLRIPQAPIPPPRAPLDPTAAGDARDENTQMTSPPLPPRPQAGPARLSGNVLSLAREARESGREASVETSILL